MPYAPCSIASRTSARMRASSSAVGARSSLPITSRRTEPWPTRRMLFSLRPCSRQTFMASVAFSPTRQALRPSCPTTTVVIPCVRLLRAAFNSGVPNPQSA